MQSETSHNEHHSLISERLSERFLWSHVLLLLLFIKASVAGE